MLPEHHCLFSLLHLIHTPRDQYTQGTADRFLFLSKKPWHGRFLCVLLLLLTETPLRDPWRMIQAALKELKENGVDTKEGIPGFMAPGRSPPPNPRARESEGTCARANESSADAESSERGDLGGLAIGSSVFSFLLWRTVRATRM